MQRTADVVIIGAGVIGCSTTYHLTRQGIANVAVVEMGQPGSGSSSKSASMLSLQFCHDELQARLALASYQRYMAFEEELGVPVDFKRTGWLTIASGPSSAQLLANAARLQKLGIATDVLSRAEVQALYPELNVADVAAGTWGPDDGSFDPHMIVWGYVKSASAAGARFHQGVRATAIRLAGGRVAGVETSHGPIAAPVVVNAAGPWAMEIGQWTGLSLPILNRARTILVTGTLPEIPSQRPFVEDLDTGWYCRPEGDGMLMGMGQEPVDDPGHVATSPQMLEQMIDSAVHRVPVLAKASMLTAWTGVRPLTPDGRPILGLVAEVPGLVLNCGWGGTGIIQAPAAGQLAAEAIVAGHGITMDLSPFSLARFASRLQESQGHQRG
jgi:sarcosine oxidase subunit beta